MRGKLWACLALTAALSGCGTAVNFAQVQEQDPPKRVYGGVLLDRQWADHFFTEAMQGSSVEDAAWTNKFLAGTFAFGCGVGVLAADLPLSVLMDTLTLPFTIPTAIARRNRVMNWAEHDSSLETYAKELAAPPPAEAPAAK